MYNTCSSATSFKINTDLGTNFPNMFQNCSKVLKIDISKFTSKATHSNGYFCGSCYILKALIIRSFGDKYVLNSNSFSGCYWLLGTYHKTYNPNTEQGYIYVPREMIATLQNETNWSTMQFRALEDYTLDGTTTGEFDDAKAGLV
jgi:surface protein